MRKQLLIPLVSLSTLGMGLAACVDTPIPNYKQPLSYASIAPYRLDVAETLLIDDSRPTPLAQEFAQKFGTTLESSLREWMHNRIRTGGTEGTYSIIIKNANFTAIPLQKSGGVEGYFTRDQAARWDGELSVTISVDGSGGKLPQGEININVKASSTVAEKASDDEKSKIYHSLVNQLMTLYNQEAEKQMQMYFAPYFI